MKKTIDLLNEVTAMGIDRDEALGQIDACIDEDLAGKIRMLLPAIGECGNSEKFSAAYDSVGEFIADSRTALTDEEIEDGLYDSILAGFSEEMGEN